MSFEKEFQHLQISLKDIILATNTFGDDRCIGHGGFGKVYKGELLLSRGLTTVAIKRLDSRLGQGANEFWKEIMLLSQYQHENLVSLLGFCAEGGEGILVYEYLSNESLDKHLKSSDLSWKQRLSICLGATRGLQYLHDPNGTQQRVLHRDIKSANILLDVNWNAKISDFGLSKIGPANQKYTFLVSNAVGTFGYCDPLYMDTGCLTKESDIYSLGVVFFEVLCGRFCIEDHEDIRRFLAKLAQRRYEEKKLDTIIMSGMKEKVSQECLQRFSTIAYQCLHRDRTKRPVVADILKELEIALQYQVEYEFEKEKESKRDVVLEPDSDEYWERKLPRDMEVIIKKLKIPHSICNVKRELFTFLNKGILFDQSSRLFWIDEDGKKCEFISAIRILEATVTTWVFQRDLRFPKVAEFAYKTMGNIKCLINTSMLSLGTMYGASLVFKYDWKPNEDLKRLKLITIKWKAEDLSVYSSHCAELTENSWYKIKMWHFKNSVPDANFEIVIEELSFMGDRNKSFVLIQGIEFQPIEMIQHEEIQELTTLPEKNNFVDEDAYWDKKLPNEYQQYIEASDKPLSYTTKKELYLLLCDGFLCHGGNLWLSLCKYTGGICSMLPASVTLDKYSRSTTFSRTESRFYAVKKLLDSNNLHEFKCTLQPSTFSRHCFYACYLVFKFEDKVIQMDETCSLAVGLMLDYRHHNHSFIHLNLIQPLTIPTIKPKNDYGSPESSDIPRIRELQMLKTRMHYDVHNWIQEREDGWMEVMLCKPLYELEEHKSLNVRLSSTNSRFYGIIVEGIEFRPYNDVSNV